MEATGMNENKAAAKTGGGIAKKARLELEGKTGKKVISSENYLAPPSTALPLKETARALHSKSKKPRSL
jgi:hypothetical protein